MTDSEKKRPPIRLTAADYNRAYDKAKQFKKLLEKGKTREEVFRDLLRLISIDE